MNKLNVFELNSLIKQVQQKANTGEVSEEALADTLQSLEIPRNEKLDGVASWIEENDMKRKWIKNKKRQLTELDLGLRNQTERLMNFLTEAIDDTGKKSIQTKNHILRPRNYKTAVVVEATKDLPIDYVERTEMIKPNKKLLYQDLMAGKEIKGAHLKKNRKTVIK